MTASDPWSPVIPRANAARQEESAIRLTLTRNRAASGKIL